MNPDDGAYTENDQTKQEKTQVQAVSSMLKTIGEDLSREGLQQTLQRFARALTFLTQGYRTDPAFVINNAIFTVETNDIVIVRDINIASLCEHHLLTFTGKAHIGYVPSGKVLSLSKLARLVDVFARRLQVQERLTKQVANAG